MTWRCKKWNSVWKYCHATWLILTPSHRLTAMTGPDVYKAGPAAPEKSLQIEFAMKTSHKLCHAALLLVFVSGTAFYSASAQEQDGQADNSAQNKSQTLTAQNQSTAQADRATTANVRKAIVSDKQLSGYAHNVKVITVNGTVTLKGPVRSDAERQQVANDVSQVVTQDKIIDQLTVKQ